MEVMLEAAAAEAAATAAAAAAAATTEVAAAGLTVGAGVPAAATAAAAASRHLRPQQRGRHLPLHSLWPLPRRAARLPGGRRTAALPRRLLRPRDLLLARLLRASRPAPHAP